MPDRTYGEYLHLGELLDAQHPVSDSHDELLFIVQHQTSELWLKVLLHELRLACDRLDADDTRPALKALARVKQVLHQLSEQWSVLATLTPSEYSGFRSVLGTSSGLQSWQYRSVEATLGVKDPAWLATLASDPAAHASLAGAIAAPSLYDCFWRWLARRGHAVPTAATSRDVTEQWTFDAGLVDVLAAVYLDPGADWLAYELCEELVDLEDGVQLWRFRHVSTVQRIIGMLPGTGGTSGTGYLRAVLDRGFFPELLAVRNRITAPAPGASR